MDGGALREYEQRLQAHAGEMRELERRHIRIGDIQIGLISLIFVGALLVLIWNLFSILWLTIPLVAIVALAIVNERTLRRSTRHRRAVSFYEYALDRIRGRWAGKGETGERFLDPLHPYAKDLDLFGQASLFEYLSTARTRAGEAALARWLLTPEQAAAGVVTASNGNHGLGVAAAARARGIAAEVFVSDLVAESKARRIASTAA